MYARYAAGQPQAGYREDADHQVGGHGQGAVDPFDLFVRRERHDRHDGLGNGDRDGDDQLNRRCKTGNATQRALPRQTRSTGEPSGKR